MTDTTRANNISANFGRAAQHEIEGEPKEEMRRLLFDRFRHHRYIARLPHRPDVAVPNQTVVTIRAAKRYVKLLVRVSTRVEELINDGI